MPKKAASGKTRAKAPKARRQRDPARTRERILDAAERAFVERGFAGSSLRDIARGAGVLQGLIHHHFGSKRALWRAVVTRHSSPYLEVQGEDLGVLDEAALPRALDGYFRFWQPRTSVLRMWSWANLEPSDPFDAGVRGALYERALPAVRSLQKRGLVRRDVHPLHVVALVAASVTFWLQNKAEIRSVLGSGASSDPDSTEMDEAFLSSLHKVFFDGGLTPPPRKVRR